MSTTIKTLKLYLQENLHFKRYFLGASAFWTIGMLLQKLILPLIVAAAFDKIIQNQASTLSWSMFTKYLVGLGVMILASQLFIDGGLVLLTKLEVSVMPRLYNRIYTKLLNQSMHFHNNSFSGSLVSQSNRFVNAYTTVTDTFVLNFSQLFVLIFFSSIILAIYAPPIALTIVIWAIVFITTNVILTKQRIKASRARAKADTVLTGYLADSVSNVGAVKTFANEPYEEKNFNRLAQDKARKNYRYWMMTIKNDAAFGMLMGVLQLLVLIVSIALVKNQIITAGILLLSQVYITQIIASLWGLSGIVKNLEQNLSDAGEMTEILEEDIAVIDAPRAKKLTAPQGAIDFKDVVFTHADNSDTLFNGLSLSIKPGEKIGLVGSSGGGKTTITKLLMRFMDIEDGTIAIDGHNIADVTQASLRRHIAYVPQEPILFHRSLSENIWYGNDKASEAEIKKAAKFAHADDFIRQLPNGYETMVGERGVKLSGGQRQRIAIARAMVKDAPILVLDEATSALDSESELLIQDALWKLMKGRTAIVIAHRLSTIQKMDRIVVLDNGTILEEGTHQELVKKKGKYAELWNHQSGGFLED